MVYSPLGAVLFDMDGTVADSEPLWFAAEKAYASAYGAHWTDGHAHSVVGKAVLHTAQTLADIVNVGHAPEDVRDILIDHMVRQMLERPARFMPGAPELIAQLTETGVPMALVTSSHRPIVEAFLTHLPVSTFDAVVVAEDVDRHKPSPDPYLLAMELLGVEARRCVVIEDSPSGIESGMSAGARVVGVPCVLSLPPREQLSRVTSIEHLDVTILEAIAAGHVIDMIDS